MVALTWTGRTLQGKLSVAKQHCSLDRQPSSEAKNACCIEDLASLASFITTRCLSRNLAHSTQVIELVDEKVRKIIVARSSSRGSHHDRCVNPNQSPGKQNVLLVFHCDKSPLPCMTLLSPDFDSAKGKPVRPQKSIGHAFLHFLQPT